MALTLIEAARLKTDPLQRGVIECFPKASPVLERLPFLTVSSDSYKFNRAATLPFTAFRGLNESYTESTTGLDSVTENLTISGGVSDVDRVLVKTQGNINDLRAIHDSLKAKSCALKWQKTFFKGDCEASPKEFDGLQVRLIGNQLINAGSSSGGDSLTLTKLDELIDAVDGSPDILFMNKTMRRRLTVASRTSSVSGDINFTLDEFGRRVTTYNDIPIGVIETDENNDEILGFTEDNPGGGTAASTSIYAVRFGVGQYVFGLQCGEMDVLDLGLYSGGTAYRTLIEWIASFTIGHNKSAARLRGIKDAAVAA
ncbi:MAG: phage major capsid protein [Deltaproteobacteria bacterium]|nr:phage major capsid protein [Deltaproteobacteria bacterium]